MSVAWPGRDGTWQPQPWGPYWAVGPTGAGQETRTAPSAPPAPSPPLLRAAQKLSLASKRKKPHPPPAPAARSASPYPTDFSGVLQLWPPPTPPCLLRATSKVKDNPGSVGKVGPPLMWRGPRGPVGGMKPGVADEVLGGGAGDGGILRPSPRLDKVGCRQGD